MMLGASLSGGCLKKAAPGCGHGGGGEAAARLLELERPCRVPSSRQLVTAALPLPLSFRAAFGANWCTKAIAAAHSGRRSNRVVRRKRVVAEIELFSSDDFDVERFLGSQGYINVSSYTPPQPGSSMFGAALGENAPLGMDQRDLNRIGGQEVGEGSVQTSFHAGCMQGV